MQEQIAVTLVKGDKVDQKTEYRDALPVNMYTVIKPLFNINGYMTCFYGLTQLGDSTVVGSDRGAIYNERQEKHFRVSGDALITVNSDGTYSELGTIPGTDQVLMAYSFNTQALVTNNQLFLYDSTNGFREVTDADLGDPIDIVWTNGRYFMTDGEYIFHTDISDETSIDPLKFATAEFMPDPSYGVGKSQDNKVIVFGRYSIEYFADTANPNFAYTRIESRALKIGITGTYAKCELNDRWYICGGRRKESVSLYAIKSGTVDKIATREVDKIIGEYTEEELSTVILEPLVIEDTNFLLVHFPLNTLCFNETIARQLGVEYAWSILRSGVRSSSNFRAINGVYDPVIGNWVYGDKTRYTLCILDKEIFSHYDEVNEWVLKSPFIFLETKSIDEIEVETIPGNTTTLDATVGVSLSYDGLTYGHEYFEMYGLPSDRSKRFIIRRLGYVPSWVGFKFRGATKSKMTFSLFKVKFS